MQSYRLGAIVGLVPKCGVVADIGTDHAYVPIKLVKEGIVSRCIASDLREGPIKIAQANINKNGLDQVIETRLGGGLSVIKKNEVDCIVIAGMGGTLIRNILDDGKDVLSADTRVIVQPNKYESDVREWFYNNNYDIYEEKLVLEGKKMYNVMCAQFSKTNKKVDPFLYYVGDKLEIDPLYGVYIRNMLRKYKKALDSMDNMKTKNSSQRERYEWIVERLQRVVIKL